MNKTEYKHVMLRELPETERPREKIFMGGAATLSNAELLAVLLCSGSVDASALELASNLLRGGPGRLRELAASDAAEFTAFRGIGPAKACKLVAAFELGKRLAATPAQPKLNIDTPSSIAALFMDEMRCYSKEYFRIIMLDSKMRYMGKTDVSIGDITSANASPREVFAAAVKKGANAIILMHNHPSGDPTPSKADLTVTAKLISAGELLEIPVLDHIVMGDGIYISMKERRIIDF